MGSQEAKQISVFVLRRELSWFMKYVSLASSLLERRVELWEVLAVILVTADYWAEALSC